MFALPCPAAGTIGIWFRDVPRPAVPVLPPGARDVEHLEDRTVPSNAIVTENQLPGTPAERLGRRGRRHEHPGLRDRHERRSGPDDLVQGQRHRAGAVPHRHLPHGLLPGQRRPPGDHHPLLPNPPAGPAEPPHRRGDRAGRCRQLGGVGLVGGAGDRHLRPLLRPASRARTPAGRAQRTSSSATTTAPRTSCSRPPTPPGRPTTAGAATASTYGAPIRLQARPRLQGQLQPAAHHRFARRRPGRLQLAAARRVPDDPLAGGQRLRRQLLHRRRYRPPRQPRSSSTRCSCRSATTSTGRASSAPTSRRPATPASTWPSSAATRSSGRPAGRPASTARARRTARWSATRSPRPTPRSTRARPGPAPGATAASARRRTAAGRRTP